MRSVAAFACLLGLTPCAPEPNAQPEETKEETSAADAKPAQPSALDEARKSVTAHMGDHLRRAEGIHDAVVLGKLADAKAPAEHLAEHWPEQVLETWVPFVNDLRHAAGEVNRAADLEAASRATAELAVACGRCHQALDKGPQFEAPPDLPEGDLKLMARHRWAADRLWEGVVQPSPQRWSEGIDGLQQMPGCQEDHGGEQLVDKIEAARRATEGVRAKAKDANTLDARAQLYGELLTTCNACHLSGC